MRRSVGGIVLGAVLSWQGIAAAQAPKDDAPAEGASATTTPEQREEARARFARGTQLYDEGEYRLALIEFERAYSIVPAYRMLYNIAQVQQQLGHYAKALAALERYLAEGGARVPAERRAAVERDLATLATRTARLTVVISEPNADVTLNGTSLPLPLARHLVDVGEHQLRVSKPGFRTETRTLILAGGDMPTIEITLVPEVATPTPVVTAAPRTNSTPAIVAWATTGALAAGSVVFGVLAVSSASDLDELRRRPGATPEARNDAASNVALRSGIADGLAVSAVVAGAIALYFTIRPPTREASTSAMRGATFRF